MLSFEPTECSGPIHARRRTQDLRLLIRPLSEAIKMHEARPWLALFLVPSLLTSLLLHQIFSGAYVQATPADSYTYFIGPISTTIPFAFWALVTFLVAMFRRRPSHVAAMIGGYLAGWIGMTAFTFWIVSLPQTFSHSSTMSIAIVMTAIMYAAIFPVLFPFGYLIAIVLWHRKMLGR